MSAFNRAWVLVKDVETATRTADLWTMNDETTYFAMRKVIKDAVKAHLNMGWNAQEIKDEILVQIAQKLPEIMAHNDGFMQELLSPMSPSDSTTDSISEVDWFSVANNFSEDIDDIIEDYPEHYT